MNDNDSAFADIIHQPEYSRFAGRDGGVLDYETGGDGDWIITHVEVPERLRGQGVAARLMEVALAWADAQGIAVGASCSYAIAYLKRHGRAK